MAATGRRCAVQLGARLQLGTEVVNRSAATVTLHRVRAVLPLPGLRPAAPVWGGCGELPPAAGGDTALPAGATAWSTITFDVLVACPRPIPVRFAVDYTRAEGAGTVELPGFADLGDVAYTGC